MQDFWKYFIGHDLHLIIIYIVISYICYQIISKIITNQTKRIKKKRQQTMQRLLKNILKYVIIILVAVKTLSILGVDVTSIVAGLGVGAIVLSLALKDMMQDILSGISIIFEDQFDVGDLVEINGTVGTVTDMGLKSTKIKTMENIVKIISNRAIVEVSNYSKNNPNLIMEIPISYEIDNELTDKVIENIIKRSMKEVSTLTGDIELLGLDHFNDSNMAYRICIPVKIDEQFKAKRQINRIIKEEFDKEKISIPFNIIEVKHE